jgi:hypothetical protein
MRERARCDARCMPRYLVEGHVPDSPAAHADARQRATRTGLFGGGVRHVRTTLLPTDEVALHLFDAPSLAALQRAGELAALHYERIVEAVDAPAEDRKEQHR